jgi:hypothetical protein
VAALELNVSGGDEELSDDSEVTGLELVEDSDRVKGAVVVLEGE